VLFVPAFPDAGRRTRDGVHRVVVDEIELAAGETEFAQDPVFGYCSSKLENFALEAGAPGAVAVSLSELRTAEGAALDHALNAAGSGVFVVPDIETTADLRLVADVVRRRRARGDAVVVRCAAPLAAMIAGCYADGLMGAIPRRRASGVLVVCGSHTTASTAQLRGLTERIGAPVRTIDTDTALRSSWDAARPVAATAKRDLALRGIAIVASDRTRRAAHPGLDDAARVMGGIVSAVRELAGRVDAVVTKGGITAAEVIRRGLGARAARVLGPAFVGVPVWRLGPGSRGETVVIVPGNVGDADLLASAVAGVLSV
jgi:uncharacterized protein YgbK (DUF1537 family)